MFSKSTRIALAVGLLNLHHVVAEWGDAELTFWSGTDCGDADTTAFKETGSIPEKIDPDATDECSHTSHSLEGFAVKDGMYQAYVRPNFLKKDCKLVFFSAPPKGDNREFNCDTGSVYQEVGPTSGCVSIPLPEEEYVMGQCCGDACKKYQPQSPSKRDETAVKTVRDVTAVKTAPLLNEKRAGECHFNKQSDMETRFMRAQKVGNTVECPSGNAECQISGTYETQAGVSHSTTDTTTVTVTASGGNPFVQFSASLGLETSVTDETNQSQSYSRSYSVNIGAGQTGYVTFRAKMICAQGTFEGDGCDQALKTDDNQWCIPAMTRGDDGKPIPDGNWAVYKQY